MYLFTSNDTVTLLVANCVLRIKTGAKESPNFRYAFRDIVKTHFATLQNFALIYLQITAVSFNNLVHLLLSFKMT